MAKARELKEDGKFLESHALQSTALELAEGFAERMHQEIRINGASQMPQTLQCAIVLQLNIKDSASHSAILRVQI